MLAVEVAFTLDHTAPTRDLRGAPRTFPTSRPGVRLARSSHIAYRFARVGPAGPAKAGRYGGPVGPAKAGRYAGSG
jgi:hypothetical protein